VLLLCLGKYVNWIYLSIMLQGCGDKFQATADRRFEDESIYFCRMMSWIPEGAEALIDEIAVLLSIVGEGST
jgi:hypothetical protein